MTAQEYIQLKAFARMDGALLAAIWTASFACYVAGFSSPTLGFIAFLLLVFTPFFVAFRLKKFRDQGLNGVISFKRALAYTMFTFFYSCVLFAAIHFIYFNFFDNGYFFNMLNKLLAAPEYTQIFDKNMSAAISQSLKEIAAMRPIDFTLNMMFSNLTICIFASIPIAAIMKKNVKP